MSCEARKNAQQSTPPPPPPPVQRMSMPTSLTQARQEFRNYRQAMGYIDQTGRENDRKSGYFDLNVETLRALMDEAASRGWNDIRVYNGMDAARNRTLLINGLRQNGGRLEEASRSDSDTVAKIENPSVAGGTDCPRWCDISGTVVGT